MEDPATLMTQALTVHRQGKLPEALALYQQALALDPTLPEAHCNLGVIYRAQGLFEAAESSYRKAIALKPGFADAHANLGNLIRRVRPEEALHHYQQAIALNPGNANLFYNNGATFLDLGRANDAVDAYRQAIALRPQFADAWNNLGVALADTGQYQEAVEAYRRAIMLQPDLTEAQSNLGMALQEQGLPEDAIAAFDKALALAPSTVWNRANRILAELYRPGVRLADMLKLAQQDNFFPAPAQGLVGTCPRPRLGFVSADFRQHAVGMLVIAALEGLRNLGFDIFAYSNSPRSDALTTRFQKAAIWRPSFGLSDDELEREIREDRIDILFDLSGYTRGHRLPVFARKPAPVQIAWVGYPATTGLPAMDYLLSDHRQTPADVDDFYSENLVRLKHSYVCFDPPVDAPEPGDLPVLKNGYVTFGCFNALKKVNSQVIEVWSRVLTACSGARLLIKAPALDCARTRETLVARFVRAGVDSKRLDIRGGSPPLQHMAAMAEADIALDTFPYSGGMTTLDQLWMGLPTITWPGETMASRHSCGYLGTLGLNEFVAADGEAYAELAIALARDTARLSSLRHSMRALMLASPLADREGFSAELAATLQAIYEKK